MPSYDHDAVAARLERRLDEVAHRRAALRREGEGMVSGELAHVDNHPADEGTETHEQELDATTELFLDEEERRIAEARHALDRGTYGICVDCGVEIPAARLEVMPETVRCVACQRTLEGLRRQGMPSRAEGPA